MRGWRKEYRLFAQEKSACLAEVMEQILKKFSNLGGTEHAQTVCTKLSFLHPCTRALEQGKVLNKLQLL